MSEPKYTQGEWRVIGEELRYVDDDPRGDLYAVIQTPHAAIDVIAPQIMKDEHMANAFLMAAAHKLYPALLRAKETIRALNGLGLKGEAERMCWNAYQHSPEMKEINAALALAGGEQDQVTNGSVA